MLQTLQPKAVGIRLLRHGASTYDGYNEPLAEECKDQEVAPCIFRHNFGQSTKYPLVSAPVGVQDSTESIPKLQDVAQMQTRNVATMKGGARVISNRL